MSIYSYTDYKKYLKSRLARGAQKQLATYIRCQPAFLSQVLKGTPHLSLEQGILTSEFFKMDRSEQEYFMLALHFGRAGSEKLSSYYATKMEQIRKHHQRVDSKIGKFETLDKVSKALFYSSWKYAVIHVLLSIPAANQLEFLKAKTKLSEHEIEKIMDFLKTAGLIERRGGAWRPTKKRIHLSPEDPLIGTHHKNFRSLSSSRLEDIDREALHFSSVMALSREDSVKIKNILLEAIAKSESLLQPSPEETLQILCLDFFNLG